MKGILKRFDFQVVVALVATISSVVILSDFLIFRFTYQAQLQGMRNQLSTVAQTAALLIDGHRLEEIPLNKEGVHTPSYGYVEDQLKKIKVANPQIQVIYVLKKIDSSDVWHFIVDVNPDGRGKGLALPGDSYDAGAFPEMLKGYDQPAADQKIENDPWGATLSGYAPIRNSWGQPVAILGVVMDASDVYAMYHQVLHEAWLILLAGIILAIVLGWIISSRVVGPINQLISGTQYVADGNLHHRVQVRGQDEISELADSFNFMAQSLEESRRKLLDYFYDTVRSLVLILESRDPFILGHSQAVADYAEKIARRMGIDPKKVEMFKKVTLLHDIGKLGIQDNVLLKPDKLTPQEWRSIKMHPILGEQILRPLLNDKDMLAVIRNHHERQDGKGYPDGLSDQQIPLLVAIVTVADSYDAMTADRPYRKAMERTQAIEQLQHGRGKQFHPHVVDIFLEILEEEKVPAQAKDLRP